MVMFFYVIFIILLVCGVILFGVGNGIKYFLFFDFSCLQDVQVINCDWFVSYYLKVLKFQLFYLN